MIPLANLLPVKITFYHLGDVVLGSELERFPELPELNDRLALGFSIQGDLRAALVLVLGRSLDASMYSELGNIIASQVVTRLADEQGLDLILSPPEVLDEAALRRLKNSFKTVAGRIYTHGKVTLQAWLYTQQAQIETQL